jgi:hypothetical protein
MDLLPFDWGRLQSHRPNASVESVPHLVLNEVDDTCESLAIRKWENLYCRFCVRTVCKISEDSLIRKSD